MTLLLLLATRMAAGGEVEFSKQIAPLLVEQCLSCHNEEKAKGGYRVDSFELLLAPGDSEAKPIQAGNPTESELYKRLVTDDEDERMPQKAPALAAEQIELVRRWIDEGAKLDAGAPGDLLARLAPAKDHPVPPVHYPRPWPVQSLA